MICTKQKGESHVDASMGKDGASEDEKLKLPVEPITRSRTKKLKSTFQSFLRQFIEDRFGGSALDIKGGLHGANKEED